MRCRLAPSTTTTPTEYPGSSLLLELARTLDAAGRYEAALGWFGQARQRAPHAVRPVTGTSRCLRALRRYDEAAALVAATPAANAADRRALDAETAWTHHDRGSPAAAVGIFTDLLRDAVTPPEEAACHEALGWIALNARRHEEGREHFAEARRLDPYEPDYDLGFAWALTRGGFPITAGDPSSICLRILRHDPGNVSALSCLGVVHFQQGRYAECETVLTSALALDPRRGARDLRSARRSEPHNHEVQRAYDVVRETMRAARRSVLGSAIVVTVGVAAIVALWTAFFLTTRIGGALLGTLTPVLVALVVVGLLLPFMIRVKLPGGVEADLAASIAQLSAGPTGDDVFGPGRFATHTDPGPRGHMPSRGGEALGR